MSVNIEKINFGGWPNCYRVSNGVIDLVATSDVGPRIIRFGFVGEKNEFVEFKEQMGRTNADEWLIFGGHRLWHSPETKARTYWPDSTPIKVTETRNGLVLEQPVEGNTGICKAIEISMSDDDARVTVVHKMTNRGVWSVELAMWALSVMAPGGIAVAPQPSESDAEGLLPNRVLILWPYTEMTDSRYTWGKKHILLRQDGNKGPTKFGLSNTDGWGAYINEGTCFLKRFDYDEGLTYPDGGANIEIYSNEGMLELESLGPLVILEPGESVEHVETWELFKSIPDIASEDDVERYILPLVRNK